MHLPHEIIDSRFASSISQSWCSSFHITNAPETATNQDKLRILGFWEEWIEGLKESNGTECVGFEVSQERWEWGVQWWEKWVPNTSIGNDGVDVGDGVPMLKDLDEFEWLFSRAGDGKGLNDELTSFRNLEALEIIDWSLSRAYSRDNSGAGSKKQSVSEPEADAWENLADDRLNYSVKIGVIGV